VGPGTTLFSCLVYSLPHLLLFLLFPFSFSHSLYLFSSFVHPFPFYQNSPTPFPARSSQEATEPWFSLFCLCYMYCLVKIYSGVLLTLCGAGVPPFRLCSSLVHSLPHLLLFITFSLFPFLIHFTYFLLLSIRSLSTRIVPLRFQA